MDAQKRKEALITAIQQKKELRGISRAVIAVALNNYLEKHKLSFIFLTPKDEKILIKEVRAKLRRSTGMFHAPLPKHLPLTPQNITALLASHASTAARIVDYPLIRRELAHRNIRSILDLGCGLNPLALAKKGMRYTAVDIREDELRLIQRFFKERHIQGTTLLCDLSRSLPDVPPHDACLLMNVLEVIETNKRIHERTHTILSSIPARFFFITFSTRTLSGKRMRFPSRLWLERLLTHLNFRWHTHHLSTEILYIAEHARQT